MNNLLIAEITIPNYIRTYEASKAQQVKYYEKGRKKLPYALCDKSLFKLQGIREPDGINYAWRSFPVIRRKVKRMIDFLIDVKTDERVIANTKKAGKPRIEIINGQDIYSGVKGRFSKNNLMNAIKDQYRHFIMTIPKIAINQFPIRFEVELWDTIEDLEYSKGQKWDLDNRIFPYNKAFCDILTELKIIPDDAISYITGPPSALFCPVKTKEERKLIFKIYSDRRDVIVNNSFYKQTFNL